MRDKRKTMGPSAYKRGLWGKKTKENNAIMLHKPRLHVLGPIVSLRVRHLWIWRILIITIYLALMDHSFFADHRVGGSGGHTKNVWAKQGASQKLRGEVGHASICTGFWGALKIFEGKLGGGGKGHAIFFRDYLKTTAPPQPVKNEWSLKELLKFCME